MANAVNHSTMANQYKVSDEVVFNIANLRSCYPPLVVKLWARWVGPFRSKQKALPIAY